MTATVYDDGAQLSNAGAGTTSFPLLGGHYGIVAMATWGGGNVQLNVLGGDGSTAIPVLPSFTANGYAYLELPPGQYTLVVTTATAAYVSVSRILNK